MSKVTSICGSPLGAGRMFSSLNRPSTRLSLASSRSPCSTTTSTAGWLSAAVVNTSLRRAGMVVLRSMILVISPPAVSTPSDNGVTSSSKTSETSPLSTPAWMAAPSATTSSGFTLMLGSLPPVSRRTKAWTAGIRVEPPTRITSSMSFALTLASLIACLTGPMRSFDQVRGEVLELRPHDRGGEVLGSVGVGGDERQIDLRLCHRRQFDLGLLGRLEQPLQRLRIFPQIDVVLTLELVGQVVDEPAVEVVATQVRITGRGADLDHPVTYVEQADVERAAAEVEDQHGLVALFVQPVGQCRGRRLVDDA